MQQQNTIPPLSHTDIIGLWAFYLAIAALVLHIPLSMIAHHFLPKVETSFASYSKRRLEKRIGKLQEKLRQFNDPAYFENQIWMFYNCVFVIMYVFGSGLFAGTGAIFAKLGILPDSALIAPRTKYLLPILTIIFFVAGVVVAGTQMFKFPELLPSKRERFRKRLQVQIDALQAELDKR